MKKYSYLFFTFDGRTTLPDQANPVEEKDIENLQYLGDLNTDIESNQKALELFLKDKEYLINEVVINRYFIKRFQNY